MLLQLFHRMDASTLAITIFARGTIYVILGFDACKHAHRETLATLEAVHHNLLYMQSLLLLADDLINESISAC